MGNLTIASAFRLRNKLKERIKKLTAQIDRADAVKDVGAEENTSLFDGKTFAQTIKAVDALMSSLRELNLAIESANVVNRADLIALETLKARIALFEDIADKCRRQAKVRYEYNTEGGKDKVELESLLDQRAIVTQLEGFKKDKESIEEKLAESNFRTAVNFDPDSVKALL
ncbi:hypothetical protein FACS189450_04920 [Spirochaetia bacterium]|nr:hypothetical protein FACS189450_04920 [Spirochaetia bacterium]